MGNLMYLMDWLIIVSYDYLFLAFFRGALLTSDSPPTME